MGSVVTMYGSQSGNSAWQNIGSYDPPAGGRIEGVCLAWSGDQDADADTIAINLTFSATPAVPVMGEYSSILYATAVWQLVTSGATLNHQMMYSKMPDIPVATGQRIYLHAMATTGVTLLVSAQIHVSFNINRR